MTEENKGLCITCGIAEIPEEKEECVDCKPEEKAAEESEKESE